MAWLPDNPEMAWATHLVVESYDGPCMRVRRSSDNAEQDIGFRGRRLDVKAMLDFVGSVDGHVTTWYDQSGHARDMVEADAARQPIIVSQGNLRSLSDDSPAPEWLDGCRLMAAHVPDRSVGTVLAVAQAKAVGSDFEVVSGTTRTSSRDNRLGLRSHSGEWRAAIQATPSNVFVAGSGISLSQKKLLAMRWAENDLLELREDGEFVSDVAVGVPLGGDNRWILGNRATGIDFFDGLIGGSAVYARRLDADEIEQAERAIGNYPAARRYNPFVNPRFDSHVFGGGAIR